MNIQKKVKLKLHIHEASTPTLSNRIYLLSISKLFRIKFYIFQMANIQFDLISLSEFTSNFQLVKTQKLKA